jgi:N utilization substance protein B
MMRQMTRHDSRILALSALFCWELRKDDDMEDVFSQLVDDFWVSDESLLPKKDNRYEYARKLFVTACSHVKEIDSLISQCSQGWAVPRMPRVDLSIIRLAVAEAYYLKEAPLEVVIDEAVELAKEFSTHPSPRFVNGVLMGIFRQLGCVPDRT